jgi:hypothetical protein
MYKNYLKHPEPSKTTGKFCTWADFIAHHILKKWRRNVLPILRLEGIKCTSIFSVG